MFSYNPLTAIDFYKADHRRQYPEGTNFVYSNFTPRSSRLGKVLPQYFDDKIVVFGIQAFVKGFLIECWNNEFFAKPKADVVAAYKKRMDTSLGPNAISMSHIEALHDLGYLPITLKALPEGSLCPIGVPVLTIQNTHPDFFWLVNYMESVLSACLWKFMTSATIALQYKKILESWCEKTGGTPGFIQFQAHDFSFRGMSGLEDVVMSGSAHLLSFVGTDSVLAIDFLENYYNADSEKELIGCSVPATEHSVMCMGGQSDEIGTFSRLITGLYPSGIISIVSDTWDFWKVITVYLPLLKNEVMAREGKVVIRPDSGDPVRIVAGYLFDEVSQTGDADVFIRNSDGAKLTLAEVNGAIVCLSKTFGTTTNDKGYKNLDSHIGLIYGDSITQERAEQILNILARKGFSSDNVVFGVGSYTYEYVTRDTFGFAMKATYGQVNGVPRDIFKCPATDSGAKKSAKGLLSVARDESGEYWLQQGVTLEQEGAGELKTVFNDGALVFETSLAEIRARLKNGE